MQGHIHKRVRRTKSGKEQTLWYVVVDVGRDESGRPIQKWHGSYRTRKEAEAAIARIVCDLITGTYTAPSGVTFSVWVRDRWLVAMASQVKLSTLDSYRRNMELHVLPSLGRRPLCAITAGHLNALYGELLSSGRRGFVGASGSAGLSLKTVRYVHTIIHKCLGDAVDASLVAQNVAARARPPRPRAGAGREMAFSSPPELRSFLEFVSGSGHRLYAAFHLAAMTGLRRGEVLGLRWADVDLDRARLAVRQSLVSVAYELVFSAPKTHQARVVDLDPATVAVLRAYGSAQDGERAEWGSSYVDSGLVFCREDGSPMHSDLFSQAFERLVARSGLKRIRLHDLRHTHATIALRAGVPVKVISERLGHESPAFTLKQYAHVIPGMQAEAAAMVAKLVEGE